MELIQEFKEIMGASTHLALATSKDNKPNVRIMSYFYDHDKGIVYVSTFKQSAKTAEFADNAAVAFTTIPHEANRLARVSEATVNKSEQTAYDLKAGFTKNNPNFENTLKEIGHMFEVYEIRFKEALVTVGPMKMEKITL